jgi:undecaprenyl diphosphate synthase
MDGNGRWARRRGLPRTDGHTAGEEALAEIVRTASDRKVGWLTAFGFSTENWVRPRTEVRHILSLHRKLFSRTEEMNRNNARTRWIGRPFIEKGARTPVLVQRAITKAIAVTSSNTGSRNAKLGALLASGMSVQAAVDKIGATVEGIGTAHGALQLAAAHKLEMPITAAVVAALDGGTTIEALARALLGRSPAGEWR